LGGFGLMMMSSVAGFTLLLGVVATWVCLAFTFRQDRVAIPLFLLRRRHRFPAVISSFTRSYARVLVEDEVAG
jgi:hypothetical protein